MALLTPELIARLDRLDLASRKVLRGSIQGDRRSRRRGQSVEFADYRPYTVGDDLRRIDWNLYGRLDKLFLRLFLEEEDLSVTLLLDQSASMAYGDPDKLAYARQLAAALGYVALARQNSLSLHGFDADFRPGLRGLRGRRELPRFLNALEGAGPEGRGEHEAVSSDAITSGNLERALRGLALHHPRPGIVIVLSDFFDKADLGDALRFLAQPRFDAHAIQVLSPQEVDPARGDITGDLRLTDLEDGNTTDVTANAAVLDRYRANLQAYCQHLRRLCHSYAVGYFNTTTDQPVDTVALAYFQQTGLLRG